MRLMISTIVLAFVAVAAVAQSPTPTPADYVRPDAQKRFHRYLKSAFGPMSIARAAASAGVSTASNTPEEWGPHWEGFGKRFASNMGTTLVVSTTRYGLGEALKLDSHFYRSKDRSTGAKVKNAVISPFTARKTDGRRTIGIPNIVGTYTGHIVARETWFPKRYTWKDGLKSGTLSLGTSVVFNLIREFIK